MLDTNTTIEARADSFPGGESTFPGVLTSLAGAAGIALLVPFGVMLVGMPVVLAVRGLLEAIGWLFGIAVR